MRLITFNTGRPYGPTGQRIAVYVHDGKAHFQDFDRNLFGTVPIDPHIEGVFKVETLVMNAYDTGNFDTTYHPEGDQLLHLGWDECVSRAKQNNACLV